MVTNYTRASLNMVFLKTLEVTILIQPSDLDMLILFMFKESQLGQNRMLKVFLRSVRLHDKPERSIEEITVRVDAILFQLDKLKRFSSCTILEKDEDSDGEGYLYVVMGLWKSKGDRTRLAALVWRRTM